MPPRRRERQHDRGKELKQKSVRGKQHRARL
jgi:hypothetical protein